jgi:hypothetical protein
VPTDQDEIRDFHQERVYAPGAGPMTRAEVDQFLASPDSDWLLKLAWVKDGWPKVAPLWYQWREGAFWVVGRKRSEWVHDLKVEPRAAICIEEQAHPRIRKVLAQVVAEIIEGPVDGPGSAWLPVAEEMATRYIGPDGPTALGPSHTWQRFLVKLTPRDGRLVTWQGADWAPRYFEPGQRPDLEARTGPGGA